MVSLFFRVNHDHVLLPLFCTQGDVIREGYPDTTELYPNNAGDGHWMLGLIMYPASTSPDYHCIELYDGRSILGEWYNPDTGVSSGTVYRNSSCTGQSGAFADAADGETCNADALGRPKSHKHLCYDTGATGITFSGNDYDNDDYSCSGSSTFSWFSEDWFVEPHDICLALDPGAGSIKGAHCADEQYVYTWVSYPHLELSICRSTERRHRQIVCSNLAWTV